MCLCPCLAGHNGPVDKSNMDLAARACNDYIGLVHRFMGVWEMDDMPSIIKHVALICTHAAIIAMVMGVMYLTMVAIAGSS